MPESCGMPFHSAQACALFFSFIHYSIYHSERERPVSFIRETFTFVLSRYWFLFFFFFFGNSYIIYTYAHAHTHSIAGKLSAPTHEFSFALYVHCFVARIKRLLQRASPF